MSTEVMAEVVALRVNAHESLVALLTRALTYVPEETPLHKEIVAVLRGLKQMSKASEALEAAREAFVNDQKGPPAEALFSDITEVLAEREELLKAVNEVMSLLHATLTRAKQ